jgi:hypothetical protein
MGIISHHYIQAKGKTINKDRKNGKQEVENEKKT